jgi:hypothetical protein
MARAETCALYSKPAFSPTRSSRTPAERVSISDSVTSGAGVKPNMSGNSLARCRIADAAAVRLNALPKAPQGQSSRPNEDAAQRSVSAAVREVRWGGERVLRVGAHRGSPRRPPCRCRLNSLTAFHKRLYDTLSTHASSSIRHWQPRRN